MLRRGNSKWQKTTHTHNVNLNGMQKLIQLEKHDPSKGLVGDCFRTSLAMLLGFASPKVVPHFVKDLSHWECQYDEDTKDWINVWIPSEHEKFNAAVNEYLATKGVSLVQIALYFDDLKEALNYGDKMLKGVPWMLSGRSVITDHAIVCLGGEVWQDPSGDTSRKVPLVGPCSEGHWWVGFLVYNPLLAVNED